MGFGHSGVGVNDVEDVYYGVVVDMLMLRFFLCVHHVVFVQICCHMNQKVTL